MSNVANKQTNVTENIISISEIIGWQLKSIMLIKSYQAFGPTNRM